MALSYSYPHFLAALAKATCCFDTGKVSSRSYSTDILERQRAPGCLVMRIARLLRV